MIRKMMAPGLGLVVLGMTWVAYAQEKSYSLSERVAALRWVINHTEIVRGSDQNPFNPVAPATRAVEAEPSQAEALPTFLPSVPSGKSEELDDEGERVATVLRDREGNGFYTPGDSWDLAVSELTPLEQVHLLARDLEGGIADKIGLERSSLLFFCTSYCGAPLKAALEVLTNQNILDGVKWDSSINNHVYTSKDVQAAVAYLAKAIWNDTYRKEFSHIFLTMPEDLRTRASADTNEASPVSHVEVIDLVSLYLRGFLYKQSPELAASYPAAMNRILRLAVKAQLGSSTAFDQEMIHVERDSRSDSFLVFCASGDAGVSGVSWPVRFSIQFGGFLSVHRISYERQDSLLERSMSYWCGGRQYTLSFEPEPGKGMLPFPPRLSSEQIVSGGFNAFATFALTSQSEESLIRGAALVMEAAGYELAERTLLGAEEMLSRFEQNLKKADFYFPVANGLNSSNFLVGERQAVELVFRKSVKYRASDESSTPVEFRVFVPPTREQAGLGSYNGKAYVTREQLARIFVERQAQGQGPLFIMNMACGSASTIPGWIGVYRESIYKRYGSEAAEMDVSTVEDEPIIFGATRGFSTDDAAIFDHLKYPLMVVDAYSRGVERVQEVTFAVSHPNRSDRCAQGSCTDCKGGYCPKTSLDPEFRLLYNLGGRFRIVFNGPNGRFDF